MKRTLSIPLAFVALLLIGASCTTKPEATIVVDTNANALTPVEDAMMEDDAMEDDAMEDEMVGSHVDYNEAAVTAAAKNGTAVLHFSAPWCPTCAALEKDIDANVAEIPAGLTIFRTDYDTMLELRKKYGVTYQHTLVQVDANGDQITKWSGGTTLDSILSKVQ